MENLLEKFDVLDDIVDKYNNTVHKTIKMHPMALHLILMLNAVKILMKKILNSKLVIMLGFQNTKTFLLKDTLKIGQKKFLLLAELKIQFLGHVISDLNGEKVTGSFYDKELQKTNQEKFRIEKVLKRKYDKLYVKWERYNNLFSSWIDKKDLLQKSVNTFLSRLEVSEEILTLKLIFLTMQQKLI